MSLATDPTVLFLFDVIVRRAPSLDTSAGRDLLIAKRRPLLLHAFSLDLANLDFSDAKALAD
jgi:hypothetical protein